ncbi:hypothetical protein LTR27_002531 [Elasticomyces elasticus]|nr:hypothetical protein LTR27_002531 [Elasticomyces elasticus]
MAQSTERFLYKILTSKPPMPIPRDLTSLDASDGFIHLSTASQTPGTAARFFALETKLWLVKVDRTKLEAGPGELRWEEASSGVFAHLYGADISESAIVDVTEQTRSEGEDWQEVLRSLMDV